MNTLKKHKLWIFLILGIVAVIYFGNKLVNGTDLASSSDTTSTDTVKRGNITSSISASGQVATANYISVTTSVNGIVKKVYVKEGDKVVAGQKLMDVTLDSEGEKSKINSYVSYLRAQNSLNAAKNSVTTLEANVAQKEYDFEREKDDNSYQSDDDRVSYKVSESEYIDSKNALNERKAEISQLQLSLSAAWLDYQSQSPTIVAPTDGIIASVLAVEGAKIENSVTSDRSVQTVAAIKKEGTPIASINLGELDINNVKVGQKVYLTLNSLVDQKTMGTIAGIDKVGAVSSGVSNYPVTVKLDKESDLVLPNMSLQAEVIIEEKQNVLYVPTAAITTSRGKSTVKVIKNGQTQQAEVQIGISDSNNTEVISGLNEGDEIVLNALPTTGFTTTTTNQTRSVGGFNAGFVGR